MWVQQNKLLFLFVGGVCFDLDIKFPQVPVSFVMSILIFRFLLTMLMAFRLLICF